MSVLKGGAAEFLADVITRQLSTTFDGVSGDEAENAKRQLELVNGLLVIPRQCLAGSSADGASASGKGAPSLLQEIRRELASSVQVDRKSVV